MRQPLPVTMKLGRYVARQKMMRKKRFPMVLMLEPTLKCNLSCTGCGKVRQDAEMMSRMMTVQECLDAVDECGAPAVSIAGGEPLVHPDIDQIVDGILAKGKLVLFCTNGILIERAFKKFKPHPFFTFVFHLDGMKELHDKMVERTGVFDLCLNGIKKAKELGYRVASNTTIYKNTNPDEIAQLFRMLTGIGVDGIITAPAFGYDEVGPANDIFPTREQAIAKFSVIHQKAGADIRYWNSPLFIDFLRGMRTYDCTPWGNPNRDPNGWKGPCYLLTDARYKTFAELMEKTPWQDYGYGKNPRCAKCMMHCGYEATTINEASPLDMWRMLRWSFS